MNQQKIEHGLNVMHSHISRCCVTMLCYICCILFPLHVNASENKTLIYEEFSKNIDKKDIAELYSLVKDRFGEQENYIQLSETDFIVNVNNGGSYRASLDTFTIDEEPFAPGISTLKHVLTDKSGEKHLIFHHHYPMRKGYGGDAYSIVTTKASINGKINISLMELGSSEEYSEEVPQFCDIKGNFDKSINTDVKVIIEDLNKDNYPDIKVVTTQLNCKTHKSEIIFSEYLATTDGFMNVKTNEDDNKVAKKLLIAQKKALSEYTLKGENSQNFKILEDAGIQNYLYRQPIGMSIKTYAGLLNDYAFYLGPYVYEKSIAILNRVLQIDPTRGVAHLNRAEILFLTFSISDVRITQKDKLDTVKNITDDYAKYKELTGKIIDKWEKFVAFNLNEYPKNMNVCEYIFRYETEKMLRPGSKRIEEIFLRTHRLDINNDGHPELVYFDEPKYGYKSYGGLRFQDSKGDWKKFDGDVTHKKPSGYGFHIFSFEGKIYKLMPDYDVTLIEGDREVLVCEAKRDKIENAKGMGEYFMDQLISMQKVY